RRVCRRDRVAHRDRHEDLLRWPTTPMNSESPFHQSPGGNPFQQQPPINPYAAPMTDKQSMGYAPSFGMDQEFVLASRWLRLAGVFIDTLIVALVCVPFLFLFVGTNA